MIRKVSRSLKHLRNHSHPHLGDQGEGNTMSDMYFSYSVSYGDVLLRFDVSDATASKSFLEGNPRRWREASWDMSFPRALVNDCKVVDESLCNLIIEFFKLKIRGGSITPRNTGSWYSGGGVWDRHGRYMEGSG